MSNLAPLLDRARRAGRQRRSLDDVAGICRDAVVGFWADAVSAMKAADHFYAAMRAAYEAGYYEREG